MKNAIAISLLIIFSLASIKEATMYAFFKINQSAIVELFCINKEEPELKCEGKCHLSAQIAKANDSEKEENASIYEQLEWHINSLEVEDLLSCFDNFEVKNAVYLKLTSTLLYCEISHPPQSLA